jgi:hypothetical protein
MVPSALLVEPGAHLAPFQATAAAAFQISSGRW